ncbi:MAG: hypothetical protein HW404_2303 [Anaerolineales bacterium]|nr:hypothetical protein [Anaerolineales bacterium]
MSLLCLDQPSQALRPDQRHVGRGDQNLIAATAQLGLGLLHGVTGAAAFDLHDKPDVRRKQPTRCRSFRSEDDQRRRSGGLAAGLLDPPEQRDSGQAVKSLGCFGDHACTEAGGQDDGLTDHSCLHGQTGHAEPSGGTGGDARPAGAG